MPINALNNFKVFPLKEIQIWVHAISKYANSIFVYWFLVVFPAIEKFTVGTSFQNAYTFDLWIYTYMLIPLSL